MSYQEILPSEAVEKETDVDLLEKLIPDCDPYLHDVIRLSEIHGFMAKEKLVAQLESIKNEKEGVVDQVATEAVNQMMNVLTMDNPNALENLGMSQKDKVAFIETQKWSATMNLRNQLSKIIEALKASK